MAVQAQGGQAITGINVTPLVDIVLVLLIIEDNSFRSKASGLVSARIGHDINSSWNVALEAFNLFNERANDIEYYYVSRLPGEPAAGVNDIHFHPAEPREFRVILAKRF